MSRLHVRIEGLVLEGVPERDAPAVAEALRAELARLLAAGPAADLHSGGRMTGASGAPTALGTAAALAVHGVVREFLRDSRTRRPRGQARVRPSVAGAERGRR